jgi:dTDP-4-amino-4,6-dideoxygalactose transaminase
VIPYGRQSVSEEDIEAVAAVLRGDWLTTGPTVDDFEEAVSAVTGGHQVVSSTSGTAALHIAYVAAGVGPGDEVVTTPMTFVATASGASILGATVRFADVDPQSGLLDPVSVGALVGDRTRVIAAVDYAGHPCDYAALQQIADRVGASTLADAAHSIGGTMNGRPVGDLADITTFSFFPTKNVTTAEGGAVTARDPAVVQRGREFHNIGLIRDPERFRVHDQGAWHQEVHAFGLNYRLTDVGCALGLSQLRRLPEFSRRRAEIKARYDAGLAGVSGLRTPPQAPGAVPVWHLYPVRILDGRRREVFDRMRAAGIGVQVNYLPVYWHPVYAEHGYRRGMCPNAEAFYEQVLSLPMFPGLTDLQVDQVVETLTTVMR